MRIFATIALTLGALYGLTYGYAGEIYDRYRELYPVQPQAPVTLATDNPNGMIAVFPASPIGNTSNADAEAARGLEHNISEIGLERTPCHGTCPSYTVIISSDGSFRYEGIMHVERIGRYTGSIDRYQFEKLAQAISSLEFNSLATSYASGLMDVNYQYLQVNEGTTTKIIESSGGDEPIELWMISTMIDQLLSEAQWD